MNKVVAFQKKTKGELITVDDDKVLEFIVTQLRVKVANGVTMSHIADKTGLNVATVSKILCEETKSPRFTTIRKIMKFLGFRGYWVNSQ